MTLTWEWPWNRNGFWRIENEQTVAFSAASFIAYPERLYMNSGGARISQRRGANHKGRGTNLLFWPISPKATWKWKNLDPEGGAPPWRPLGSANDEDVFPKYFHWIRWIQWQKYYYFKKIAGLESTISFVRNRDSTIVPQTHSQQRRQLNWSWFMLQWFLRFPAFAEFSESSAPFRETPLD